MRPHSRATAFCRYFKSHTNKTYTQFLNDIKVDNACWLLMNNRLSISQICFETGFNNFTIRNENMEKLYKQFPKWQEFGRNIWETAFLNGVQDILTFQTLTAEERYLTIMKHSELL
ncbi:helix-turn-helix domain-containing protein [Runella zeae]|uniref:helix-turn-helix domain-containing protein n=1 Tax=Runella zeae TaxID=94255 RepID=UPI002354F153|nr:helix-turn-helix domain-containing protein [Runella zeae]